MARARTALGPVDLLPLSPNYPLLTDLLPVSAVDI